MWSTFLCPLLRVTPAPSIHVSPIPRVGPAAARRLITDMLIPRGKLQARRAHTFTLVQLVVPVGSCQESGSKKSSPTQRRLKPNMVNITETIQLVAVFMETATLQKYDLHEKAISLV